MASIDAGVQISENGGTIRVVLNGIGWALLRMDDADS